MSRPSPQLCALDLILVLIFLKVALWEKHCPCSCLDTDGEELWRDGGLGPAV